ncbi:caspase-like [Cloeon dipterum]|uniref:caspase-like n=1 Tax=Cloeon dipterum TaxID=197152 RepID=UPI00321FA9A2
MSENKKVENNFESQTEEEDQKTESISKPSDEELDPSWSEEMHLKGADTGDGVVVSQLVESLKNLYDLFSLRNCTLYYCTFPASSELPSSATVDGLQQYKMSHEKRGKAIIFNHNRFNPYLNLHTREGTKKDVERLEHVFNMHSFEVTVYNDLRVSNLFTAIKTEIANADHSNADCVAVVILTHGVDEFLYGSDAAFQLSTVMEMITPDKCLSLAGKPKLIFVQASNGDKVDHGGFFFFRTKPMSVKIPSYKDFLIAKSRARGTFCNIKLVKVFQFFFQVTLP